MDPKDRMIFLGKWYLVLIRAGVGQDTALSSYL